ncbi:nucleotidyltransferase family protein [Brevibacterium sp. CBA3109]|uniref:Nucleotidyltransferase family protein n=1 Tax=Brevibacterium koreense TaxID=3140787 RepID=A0AAU7UM44_9MICO
MSEASRAPGLILLAAGNGTRMGGPKALLRYADGTSLLTRQVERMTAAAESRGLSASIIVVLGPALAEASRLVPAGVRIVENPNHTDGLSTSLNAGLRAVPHTTSGAVVSLLDLPDIPAEAYGRLVDAINPDALARAHWHSRPGHPVAIGREYFAEAIDSASGDEGLRVMLRRHEVSDIECADLLPPELDGHFDVDTPEAAARRGLHLNGIHS